MGGGGCQSLNALEISEEIVMYILHMWVMCA